MVMITAMATSSRARVAALVAAATLGFGAAGCGGTTTADPAPAPADDQAVPAASAPAPDTTAPGAAAASSSARPIGTLRACALVTETQVLTATGARRLQQPPQEQNSGTAGQPLERSQCTIQPVFRYTRGGTTIEGNGFIYVTVTRDPGARLTGYTTGEQVTALGDGAVWLAEGRRLVVLANPVQLEVATHAFSDANGTMTDSAAYRPIAEKLARLALDRLTG